MDTNSSDAVIRQNLLDRLLHAVKQVQVHFGARQEIATETDVRVSTLCTEWEAVLLHGQRKPKPKRIVPPTRGGGLGTLWPLAKLACSQEELQRFLQLENTRTEIGRGRAWLRAAINERTLENYMHTILGSDQALRGLYLENAFVLDLERASMLPVMAAGLCSIIFSIPINADYLNTSTRVDFPLEATPPPVLNHTPTIIDRMAGNNDDGDDIDDVVAVNAKEKKKKKKKPRPQQNESQEEVKPEDNKEMVTPNNSAHHVSVHTREMDTPPIGMDTPPIGESASSSSSRLSINEEGVSPMYVSFGLEPVSRDFGMSETEAAVNATALVLSATTSQPVEGVRSVESGDTKTKMSAEELREAVLVLVKAKKELEDTNSHLRGMVAELESTRSQLLSDLEASTNEIASLRESHTSQLAGLERENDLLREQLKKYVGMVRNSTHQSDESLVPSSTETEGQEQKLAQMAEMYGELMELNERLHKTVSGKDTLISTLVASITKAGLQLPVPADSLPPGAIQPKALVDMWIPSAIKKGRGPDGHYVYQVFIRVRKEEWNVYRRYAEFREFHTQLAKHLPQVNSFNFPPRKTRNKTSHLVEERRLKLQDYLRQVVHLCSTTPVSVTKKKKQQQQEQEVVGNSSPILQADINKSNFVHLFPFFREDLYVDSTRPSNPSYSGL